MRKIVKVVGTDKSFPSGKLKRSLTCKPGKRDAMAVPNTRKSGKAFVGGYVPEALKKELQTVADRETQGSVATLIQKMIAEGLMQRAQDMVQQARRKAGCRNQ